MHSPALYLIVDACMTLDCSYLHVALQCMCKVDMNSTAQCVELSMYGVGAPNFFVYHADSCSLPISCCAQYRLHIMYIHSTETV